MDKNLIIIGLALAIVGLAVAFLFSNGILNLSGESKFKNQDEVSNAAVGIGSGVENIGSILEEIDNGLG